ncbi:MAG: hypothetical protein WBC44_20620 [Planctomycetaceae bacterium]
MRRKLLWGTFVAVMFAGMTLPAEAGRRHGRSCSSCSGGSSGAWYHFTSGSGSYVPFASQTVATSYGDEPMAATCGAPATYHQASGHSYHQGYVSPAVHRDPSGCRNCGW